MLPRRRGAALRTSRPRLKGARSHALDHLRRPAHPLVAGHGGVLHARRVHPHPAVAGDCVRADSDHSGTQTRVNVAERDDTRSGARRDTPSPAPASPASRSSVRLAIDVRNTALTILAVAVAVAFLWWAQAVFIPVFLAVLISHALEPVVAWLERQRCPRAVGTFFVLGSMVIAVGYGAYALGVPAASFIDQMPSQARKLRIALESNMRNSNGTIDRVKQAANELEKVASTAASPPATPVGVQRVRVEEPPFRLGDLLWRGSRGLLEFLASIAVVFFLTYYLLLAGDLYRRKLAIIAGPSLRRRRLVLRILLDIDSQIRRYLIARFVISVVVAVATWGAMTAMGLKQAVM